MNNDFSQEAMLPSNPHWEKAIAREKPLYHRDGDCRNDFERDYTRILHSLGYRRMKHKTQVFFNGAGNDHICTRIEHVAHVESVSSTISRNLNLNSELTKAIAIAHDVGHSPFGHQGERCLSKISEKYLNNNFWHEKNGVYFVENIELLDNPQGKKQNLNLTYAVRDGIISHCGEVDENGLRPRNDYFDLSEFDSVGKYNAATWEGCVVKLADKIAYLGRDIEDAKQLGYFSKEQIRSLENIAKRCNQDAVNTTVITYSMIKDICENSSPEKGLCFSDEMHSILTEIKTFNYNNIYLSPRLNPYKNYVELILTSLFEYLMTFYDGIETFKNLKEDKYSHHDFQKTFAHWLAGYCDVDETYPDYVRVNISDFDNKKIYGKLDTKEIYYQAILDFIAGMTDNYAITAFNELLSC